VVQLHAVAQIIQPAAIPEAFGKTLVDLIANLGRALPKRLNPIWDRWQSTVTQVYDTQSGRLDARARHGAVRHGHGDLHLRNACRFRGRVVLFDAIEFAPEFSHVDILYDMAFAVMDLRHRDKQQAAIVFLSRYLAAMRDYREIAIIRLFMSVRAAIRALVVACSPESNDDELTDYMNFARQVLAPHETPRLIAIGGRSGTGKSTLAQMLAPICAAAPNIVILRSDEIRKHIVGRQPDTALPAAAYDAARSRAVYRRLRADAARVLQAGAQVIVDATFFQPDERDQLRRLAERLNVPFTGFWLTAPAATLQSRLMGRHKDASDADASVMLRQPVLNTVEDWHTIDTTNGAQQALADMRRALQK